MLGMVYVYKLIDVTNGGYDIVVCAMHGYNMMCMHLLCIHIIVFIRYYCMSLTVGVLNTN